MPRYGATVHWGVVVNHAGQLLHCGQRIAWVLSATSVELLSATEHHCKPGSREEIGTAEGVKNRLTCKRRSPGTIQATDSVFDLPKRSNGDCD